MANVELGKIQGTHRAFNLAITVEIVGGKSAGGGGGGTVVVATWLQTRSSLRWKNRMGKG